jgi:predicted nucleotidyltransferase
MSADISDVGIPQNLPGEVRTWLSEARNALVAAYGEELEALILFGSAAEGRMRASSDVNLLIVLQRFDALHSDKVSEVMQSAAAAVQLHPMFVLATELQLAAESFAVKFLTDRCGYARGAGLSIEQMPDVLAIDAAELRFAACSYERKRRPR